MIGVAGCGRMGKPMLAALRGGGFEARGFDVLDMEESWITDDASIFALGIETLITVVRDQAQTEEVLFGAQSFVTAPALKRIIICSTLSPRYLIGLHNRVPEHISLIDAPMSGAQVAAETASLSFMIGGEDRDLDEAQPMFNAMGRHFHRMGPFGAGMQAKVLNNLLAATNTAMTRLVLDWADKIGMDEEALLKLISTSSGQNWFATNFDNIEFSRDGHSLNNSIGILVKDIASALDAAPANVDTSLPETIQSSIKHLKPRH
ncbi:MAG: NAD(P)-binding domain-containing protein [Pseudomonadota bacterium]